LIRDLLLGEVEINEQTFKSFGAIHRIEVFSLKVFNQRPFGSGFIVKVSDKGWNAIKSCKFGSTPTSLPCNEFIYFSPSFLSNHNWLHQACSLDRLSQSQQALLVKDLAWLIRIRNNKIGGKIIQSLL